MPDITAHIARINIKLQELLKKHAHLQQDHSRQIKVIAELQQSEKDLSERLESMQQQQLILKASLDKMDEKEKKELERRISGYVRNIDKCISLLSHKQNP